MSPLRKILLAAVLLVLAALPLAGCGDTNSQSNFDANSGTHPADWLPLGHTVAADEHLETCTECHGSDLAGGISKVPCTQCHLGTNEATHPLQWGAYAYALHATFVKLNGTASCAEAACHGTTLEGVAGSGPACTSCHLGGPTSKHPQLWDTNVTLHMGYVAQNGTASCQNALCHGTDLKGVFLSGPSCNACHQF